MCDNIRALLLPSFSDCVPVKKPLKALPTLGRLMYISRPTGSFNYFSKNNGYVAVLRITQMIFRHTNELRNFALITHNSESSLFAALNIWFVLGAARLVVFRLVGFGDAIG